MRILKEGAELGTAEKKLNNLLIWCQNCVFGALITNSLLFLKTNGRPSLASSAPLGFVFIVKRNQAVNGPLHVVRIEKKKRGWGWGAAVAARTHTHTRSAQ